MNTKFTTFFKLTKLMTLAGIFIFCFSAFKPVNEWFAPKEADKLVNPLKDNIKATKKGEKLYNSLCWSCHGTTGQGDGPAGKMLNPKPANHTSADFQNQSDGAIYWKLSSGRTMMPAYGKIISKTERWQLVNYMRTLSKK